MKRFIDLTGQIDLDDERRSFAWYDTINCQFELHGTSETWDSWEDFAEDYDGDDLDRYRRLTPVWAFGAPYWRTRKDEDPDSTKEP